MSRHIRGEKDPVHVADVRLGSEQNLRLGPVPDRDQVIGLAPLGRQQHPVGTVVHVVEASGTSAAQNVQNVHGGPFVDYDRRIDAVLRDRDVSIVRNWVFLLDVIKCFI